MDMMKRSSLNREATFCGMKLAQLNSRKRGLPYVHLTTNLIDALEAQGQGHVYLDS